METFLQEGSGRLSGLKDRINYGAARLEVLETLLNRLSDLDPGDEKAARHLVGEFEGRWPGMLELRWYVPADLQTPYHGKIREVNSGKGNQAIICFLAQHLWVRRLVALRTVPASSSLPGYTLNAGKEKMIKQRFLGENRSIEFIAARHHDLVTILTPQGERQLFWDLVQKMNPDGSARPTGLALITLDPAVAKQHFTPRRQVEEAAAPLATRGIRLGMILQAAADKTAVEGKTIPRDVTSFQPRTVADDTRGSVFLRLSETGEEILYLTTTRSNLFPEEADYRLWFQLTAGILATSIFVLGFLTQSGTIDLFISLRFQVAALFALAGLLPLGAIVYGGMKYLDASRNILYEDAYRRLQEEVYDVDNAARAMTADLQRMCGQVLAEPALARLAEEDGKTIPVALAADVMDTLQHYRIWTETSDAVHLYDDFFVYGINGDLLMDSNPGTRGIETKLMRGMSRTILEFTNRGKAISKDTLRENRDPNDIETEFILKSILREGDVSNNQLITQRGRIHHLQVFGNNLNFYIEPLLDRRGLARYTLILPFVMPPRYRRLAIEYVTSKSRKEANSGAANEQGPNPVRLFLWPLPPENSDKEFDAVKHEAMAISPLHAILQRVARERDALRDRYHHQGGEYLLFATPLRVMDSYVVAGVYPVHLIDAELTLRREYFLYIILCSLAVALLASWGVSRRFLMPVAQVQRGVDAIADGNLGYRMDIESNDELGRLSNTFNSMVGGLQEKERMSRYVSDFVREAVKTEDSGETLGETMKATVLFSDIRGFTTLSETHPPTEIVAMLNEYLERMTVVIQEHGGVVDKFIGDAVMAVFYPDKDGQGEVDERRALRAAMGMRDALAEFNRERLTNGLFEIDNGIGLNTGDVIIGSIGARKHRVDLTVIGDNVNIAARLESESKKGRHTKVVLSETTFSKVEDLVTVEPLTVSFVKGKSREVRMFEVVKLKGTPNTEH